MKKTIAYCVATIVTLLSLSSCLGDTSDTSTSQTCYGFVTVDANGYLYPDCCPGMKLAVSASTLSSTGLSKYKRAYAIYEVPSSTKWTYGEEKTLTPTLGTCYGVPMSEISEQPDTLTDYTGQIGYFNIFEGSVYTNNQFFMMAMPGYSGDIYNYPGIYVYNGSLNLFFVNETSGSSVLAIDSIDNAGSTAYMSLRTKTGVYYTTPCIQNYSLSSSDMLQSLSADKTDSITLVISARTAASNKFCYKLRCAKSEME